MNNSYINMAAKFYIISLGLFMLSLAIDAQSIRYQVTSNPGVRNDIPSTKKQMSIPDGNRKKFYRQSSNRKKKESVNDTVYCVQTKKQHGWFAPVRIITKEEASHRGLTYRFTNRNSRGNWRKMELIDGYGNYTTGGMSPYILKVNSADTDSLANSDWVEKIKTECIYEFISDPTGKDVIQERAYDKDMNIVYTYSRTPIGTDSLGHKKFVGSYRDYYGLPAEMRKDTTYTYTYGTLVMLTEDCWGNDSVIEFMDAKGFKKLNSDGVAMEVFICDKDGHPLKQQSRDSDGNLIIDNWGNCGIEYVWNADHTIASATYMDANWQPMRMPSLRSTDDKDDVFKTVYKYDQYARETEQAYFTSDDKPDKNGLGVHRTTYSYDERGNMVESQHLDINDNLIVNGQGCAIYRAQYNESGNPVLRQWFDQAGVMYYKETYRYDNKGKQIQLDGYSIKNGIEALVYKNEITDSYEHYIWSDGTSRIDSIDVQGRQTKSSYFDSKGELYVPQSWAEQITTYQDFQGKTIESETTYDSYRKPIEVDGIFKTISVIDSVHHYVSRYRYDKGDFLKETYGSLYDKDFANLLGQYDTNAYGHICRTGGSGYARYYYVDVLYNQKGKFASFIGRDEFGEPDYIVAPSFLYYYQRMTSNGNDIYYDENSDIITDFNALRNSLPKVMTIEVVDSSAYSLGLRDNDVILLYGDYAVDLENVHSYFDFRRDWSLRSALDARKNKRMVVFRIEDASKNKYGLVEINNLSGTPSELGFLVHIRYLTKKQLARIQGSVKDNMQSENPMLSKSDFGKSVSEGDNYIIMAFTEMYRSDRNRPYAQQITDPAILLGACIKDRDMYWDMSAGRNTEVFEEMLNSRKQNAVQYPTMQYYLTKDLQNVTLMKLEDYAVYTNWFGTTISDEDYASLVKLNEQAQSEMVSIRKMPPTKKPKGLYGRWQTDITQDNLKVLLELALNKDGSSNIVINAKMEGEIQSNIFLRLPFIVTANNGKWESYASILSLDYEEAISDCSISQIEIEGIGEDEKAVMIKEMQTFFEQNKSELSKDVNIAKLLGSTELIIEEVTKKELKVSDGSNTYIFRKMKGTK